MSYLSTFKLQFLKLLSNFRVISNVRVSRGPTHLNARVVAVRGEAKGEKVRGVAVPFEPRNLKKVFDIFCLDE